MKIGLVSLGCDKNRVDAEKMLARLLSAGYTLTQNEDEADVILINTCAFIDAAKREAIGAILDAVDVKKRTGAKIVVSGCFSTRYLEEAKAGFPEADAFVPVKEEDEIVDVVNALFERKGQETEENGRILTTPSHYAYLKIAEGCNNRCSYCAIPAIRGKYVSEPMEKLLEEGKNLAENGVKELIVVAQDTTNYGVDLYGKKMLVPLLKELCKLDFWKIRLLYAYPERIDDELLDFIDKEEKMAKYLDIPMQHIDDGILKRMRRASDGEKIRSLLKKIRSKDRYIAVRSSFIVGFPGETDEAQERLKDFVKENIDYAGFFVFSPEEGTEAYGFKDKIKKSVAKARKTEAEKAQQQGLAERQKRFLGKTVEVICDGIDEKGRAFVGRTEYQTPEVDTKVLFKADFNVTQGEVYEVRIDEAGFDLKGTAIRRREQE
ncbi:MAG: 30S ribosomal protein S12 methylthiotransferase RimO [Clostridia bacterium]|nr:30S ribosomal protein S12 methylthiotransferase RimO [Clostridia bacterium]